MLTRKRPPLCHTNRHGVAYYLHEGRTKTGKPRFFFAKSVGEGAIATLPEGLEIAESVNGVVSVRKVLPSVIPAADVALARAAVARDARLRHHVVEAKRDAIVIHAPEDGSHRIDVEQLAAMMYVPASRLAAHYERVASKARVAPVMKFEPAFAGQATVYLAFRWTYRGDGGWYALSTGKLAALLSKYLPHLGRDSFFELM